MDVLVIDGIEVTIESDGPRPEEGDPICVSCPLRNSFSY